MSDEERIPRRRMTDVSDRDPYEVTIELVRTVRDEMRAGFDRLEASMATNQELRQACQQDVRSRLTELEHWRERVVATYAVVAAVVSAIVSALTAWIHGRH